MPKKKVDRWKNWQPPEKLWWKLIPIADEPSEARRKIREEVARECRKDRDEMVLAINYARYLAKRMFLHEDEQKIRDNADDNVGYGYYLALRDFKPDKGSQFKTFLYRVLSRRAGYLRRQFMKTQTHSAKNHITVECKGNVVGRLRGICREEGIPELAYTILNFDRFICLMNVVETNEGNIKQFMESNHHDLIKEESLILDDATMSESMELLAQVRNISDAEFRETQRRYLPAMYRKMTDAKLHSELSLLDVRIFELATTANDKRGYGKANIQNILGIKRDFLHSRFMAILERLKIPYESAIRWYANHKIFKRKRERRKRTPIQSQENENVNE